MKEQHVVRVLIVEDDASIRLSLAGFLEDQNFEVFAAGDGQEALRFLRRQSVEVAIIDMRLPGELDGNALVLHACEIQPGLRVLIHTGSVDYHLPEALKAQGITAQQVMHKPIKELQALPLLIRQLAYSTDTEVK